MGPNGVRGRMGLRYTIRVDSIGILVLHDYWCITNQVEDATCQDQDLREGEMIGVDPCPGKHSTLRAGVF